MRTWKEHCENVIDIASAAKKRLNTEHTNSLGTMKTTDYDYYTTKSIEPRELLLRTHFKESIKVKLENHIKTTYII